MRITLFVISALLVISCGRNSVQRLSALEFDSSVPADQQETIRTNLSLLANYNLPMPSEASKYGFSNFSGNSLVGWLLDRVSYVVGESYDYTSASNRVSTLDFNGFSQGINLFDENAATTIMSNIGGSAFKEIVGEGTRPFSLKINGVPKPINSPRVGIIKIGAGLFMKLRFKKGDRKALSDIASLIATFIHEGRHSDGNYKKDSICFSHIKCSSGDFKGDYACDRFKNGAYNIGAYVLQAFYLNCPQCDAIDKNLILLQAKDQLSRTDPSVTNYGDNEPDHL